MAILTPTNYQRRRSLLDFAQQNSQAQLANARNPADLIFGLLGQLGSSYFGGRLDNQAQAAQDESRKRFMGLITGQPNNPVPNAGQPMAFSQTAPQSDVTFKPATTDRQAQILSAIDDPWLDDGSKTLATKLLNEKTPDRWRPLRPEETKAYNLDPSGSYLVNDNSGEVKALSQPQNKPADILDYEYAKQQGFNGSLLDYQTQKAAAGRAQSIINMPGNPTPDEIGKKAFAEANAKSQADYWDKVRNAGVEAYRNMGYIGQLADLLRNQPTGAGQDWVNKAASYATRLGVDTSDVANLPAAQAAQAIISRLAPSLRVQGTGATSDFEMRTFLQSLPSISNTPGGNAVIASNLDKIAQRSVQEANIASQVQNGEITPGEGTKKILALGPLNLDIPQGAVPQQTPAAPDQAPTDRPQAPQAPAAPQSGAPANADELIQQAKDAISRGAPRDQVIERLKKMGVVPMGL